MMKTKFNFWRVMAAAAIMFSAGVGYADATAMQTATHYNVEPDANKPADWQPITPGSPGENACTSSPSECKAIETSPGLFDVVTFGNLM